MGATVSVKNMSWVFDHSPYSLGTRLVHLALADEANDTYNGLLWISQGTIAAKAKVARTTVTVILKRMVADGWLDEVTGPEAERIRPLMADKRAKVYRFRTCRKSDTSREEPVGLTDAMCRVDDARCVGLTESRLLLTQEVTQENPSAEIGFDDFWGVYPSRAGRKVGKADAKTKWDRLTPPQRAEAYQAAKNLAAAVDRGDTLPKDAHRFLVPKVWRDWLAAPVAGGPVRRGDKQASDWEALETMMREGMPT